MKRLLVLMICASLVLTGFISRRDVLGQPPPDKNGQKVLVDATDQSSLSALQAVGAEMLADYGSFSLWQLPTGQPLPSSAASATPVADSIYLRGSTSNTVSGQDATLLPFQNAGQGSSEQFWLVQFIGPIQNAWLADLRASGLALVSYVPDHAYVVWGIRPDQIVLDLQKKVSYIQWAGPYQAAYRLSPDLLTAAAAGREDLKDVTVQFYNSSALNDSLNRLEVIAELVYAPPVTLQDFTLVRLQVTPLQLANLAAWPDIFNIEPYHPPKMLDEIQGQILAGNLTSKGNNLTPTGPGYLEWLASKGFPTDPAAYPIVDLVDDGLDQGDAEKVLHPDFYQLGDKSLPNRVSFIQNCSSDSLGNGVGGHGDLNAGILAGYNNQSGFPYRDLEGYQLGLGISPYGRIASSKVFTDSGFYSNERCGQTYQNLVQKIYTAGARITSNSWGDASAGGAYTTNSYLYDLLTRDASKQDGNQEMLHVFAAGNNGAEPNSVNAPGTAKNVLTVGAIENVRAQGKYDGCLAWEANNANDIAIYSSRGPTFDKRIKPDLVAPGTHVQGPASQDPAYNASGICGGYAGAGLTSKYYPANQTLYTWSSGTSHATPAVAGAAQLAYEYYGRVLKPDAVPSPAMLKALLLNSPRYLTGQSANDTLPSTSQGWGAVDLGQLFDHTPRILKDQDRLFTSTGETYELTGKISDPSKPFRVSLVWTDAPGSTTASQVYVNNLDLEVSLGDQVYKGNVFKGAFSISGGEADPRDNVENVFIAPQSSNNTFRVKVIVRNLAGDGVPGNASPVDQDFALVVYNGFEAQAPVLSVAQVNWVEKFGNQNQAIDPGETLALQVALKNQGTAPVTHLKGVLKAGDQQAVVLSGLTTFPSIEPQATRSDGATFWVDIPVEAVCGTQIPLKLDLSADGGYHQVISIMPLQMGKISTQVYKASGMPTTIPDRLGSTPGQVLIPIRVPDHFSIADLDVQLSLNHSYIDDLVLSLLSPNGAQVLLSRQNGSAGQSYQETIFDDQAPISIQQSTAPFAGRYRPQESLALYNGQDIAGEWNLKITDEHTANMGEVQDVQLAAQQVTCSPYELNFQVQASPEKEAAGAPGTDIAFNVQVTNDGSSPDIYEVYAAGIWPVRVESNLLSEVMPLETQSAIIYVTVPPDSDPGEIGQVMVTIASQNHPEQQTGIVLNVQTIGHYWLPLVSQR